jgi:ketosteroid isomerase-like protein
MPIRQVIFPVFGEGIEEYFRHFSKIKKMFSHKVRIVFSFLFLIFLSASSCKTKIKKTKAVTPYEMIKADEDFSNLSKKEGMKKAFIEYIDNEGILLRPNHPPIAGADAIDFLSQVNDSAYILTWKPGGGEIASSGDMGFTYGIYNLEIKDTVLKGTYVSVWKKQPDGKWKFVLDCGNEGIGQ